MKGTASPAMRFLTVVLLWSLAAAGRLGAAELGAQRDSPFVVDTTDWPIGVVLDQSTSEPLGLIRHDLRGTALYQMECSDDRFVEFGRELVESLNSGASSTASEVLRPGETAEPTTAPEAGRTELVLRDVGTTCAAELKALVEQRGAAAGFRQMARTQLIAYLKNTLRKDHNSLMAEGSLIAPRTSDGRFLHPVTTARALTSDPGWDPKLKLVVNAPGAARTRFLKRLGDILEIPVAGPNGLLEGNGYSQVDLYMYSEREIRDMAAAWHMGGEPDAAFSLFLFYDTQAMNRSDEEEILLKEARKYLTLAAEAGHPPAMYNAAYWALNELPPDTAQAEKWLKKLHAHEAIRENETFAVDVKALQADLEQVLSK